MPSSARKKKEDSLPRSSGWVILVSSWLASRRLRPNTASWTSPSAPGMLTPALRYFLFKDTSPTEIYTLSLHDALPISGDRRLVRRHRLGVAAEASQQVGADRMRSEEHTSELQSRENLVCRLLLEKKKKKTSMLSLTKKKKKINKI